MKPDLQEYDVVRVIRLILANRPFSGTDEIARLPRLGDVGTIVSDYGLVATTALLYVSKLWRVAD